MKTLASFRVAALLVLFTTHCCTVRAQSIVGSIGGSVSDSTGAAVPGATVSVVNKATNETRTFSTDSAGSFTVSALIPGVYQIRVEAQGFKISIADNVTVAQGANTRVDPVLTVGSISQTVSVDSAIQ